MPAGTVDASVNGEWSLTQTLRHLVMAADTWLGRAILEQPQPLPSRRPAQRRRRLRGLRRLRLLQPSFMEVLAVRADRQAMVHTFLASVTLEELVAPRRNPHAPQPRDGALLPAHDPSGGVGAPPICRA